MRKKQKTYQAKAGEVERKWYLVDADGKVLGRLATRIARILTGKHKPEYTPHIDTGDFVVVVNCEKLRFTGDKLEKKIYRWYTGYPGGLRQRTLKEQLGRKPEEVLRRAVKGMLPKTKMGRRQLSKLKIYAGSEHSHSAQKPTPIEV